MFTQKFIKIFHSVQEIGPFSLLKNLALSKASTDDKCHFAIVSLFSEFEARQKLNQSQMSFGVHLVNINVYAKFHHSIPLNRPSPKFSQLVLITWFPVCGWYNQLMILVLYFHDPVLINQTIKSMLLLQMNYGCILLCRYI